MLSVFIESSIELSNRAEVRKYFFGFHMKICKFISLVLQLYSLTLDIVDLISDWHALLPLVCNLSRQEYCLMVFLEKLKKSVSASFVFFLFKDFFTGFFVVVGGRI